MLSNSVLRSISYAIILTLLVSCNRTANLQVSKPANNGKEELTGSEIKAPVGFREQEISVPAEYFTVSASEELSKDEIQNDFSNLNSISDYPAKEKEDTTKVEPKFEPLVLGGTATAVGGLALGLLGLTGTGILLLIGAGLLVVSAIITMIGWKKIKADPKTLKGEKLAILNYIIIGLCGVAASFYLLYLLFTF